MHCIEINVDFFAEVSLLFCGWFTKQTIIRELWRIKQLSDCFLNCSITGSLTKPNNKIHGLATAGPTSIVGQHLWAQINLFDASKPPWIHIKMLYITYVIVWWCCDWCFPWYVDIVWSLWVYNNTAGWFSLCSSSILKASRLSFIPLINIFCAQQACQVKGQLSLDEVLSRLEQSVSLFMCANIRPPVFFCLKEALGGEPMSYALDASLPDIQVDLVKTKPAHHSVSPEHTGVPSFSCSLFSCQHCVASHLVSITSS